MSVRRVVLVSWVAGVVACGGDGSGARDDGGAAGTADAGPGSGSDGGAVDARLPGGSDGAGADTVAPDFPGVVFAYGVSTSRVELHWLPAVDDVTPQSQLRYHIYTADDAASLPGAFARGDTPAGTVVGETSFPVDGLAPDQSLFVLVVAEDGAGNTIEDATVRAVRSLPFEPVVKAVPIDVAAAGWTVIEHGRDDFSLAGPGVDAVVVGDIVVLQYSLGRWLRRVVAIQSEAGGIRITTEHSAMSDLFQDAVVRSHTGLVEPLVAEAAAGDRWLKQYADPSGTVEVRQTRVGQPGAGRLGLPASEGSVELAAGVTYGYYASFTPTFDTEIEWAGTVIDRPKKLQIVARGDFVFQGEAGYFYEAAANRNTKKLLFDRTVTLRYVVGGVPVIQDVTLRFYAELKLTAGAQFNVNTILRAQKALELQLDYTDTNGWSFDSASGFEQTFNLTVNGKAEARAILKVTGELSTTFYKAAEAKLSVSPTLDLDAAARFSPPPAEFERFDVTFFADAWVEARLSILGAELASWRSENYRLVKIPLFGLPELKMVGGEHKITTCKPKRLYLSAADGVNNGVVMSSIQWEVVTSGPGGSAGAVAGNPLIAQAGSAVPTTFVVRASGYGDGVLGSAGRVYSNPVAITVEEPPGGCDLSEPDVTGEDVIACDSRITAGIVGPPVISKRRVVPGEPFDISFPMFFDGGGYLGARVRPVMNTLALQYNGEELVHDSSNPSGGLRAFVGDQVMVDTQYQFGLLDTPGTYAIQYSTYARPSCSPGEICWGAHSTCTNLGQGPATSEDMECWPTRHKMFGQWIDPGTTDTTYCEMNMPYALPKVELVAAEDGDGNGAPDEASELPINGGGTTAEFSFARTSNSRDPDWYRLEPSLTLVHDAPIGYSPGCELTIAASGEGGAPELAVYDDLAKARQGVGALMYTNEGGFVVVSGELGKVYYVEARNWQNLSVYSLSAPYFIEVTSDCGAGKLDAVPQLTAAPLVTPATFAPGDSVQVTVSHGLNVDRVTVYLRAPDGSTAADFARATGRVGTNETVLTIPTYGTLTETDFWVDVRLTGAESPSSTRYRRQAPTNTSYEAEVQLYDAAGDFIGYFYLATGLVVPNATAVVP